MSTFDRWVSALRVLALSALAIGVALCALTLCQIRDDGQSYIQQVLDAVLRMDGRR